MVGSVTSLKIQEARGEVVRVTWVGVQGATAYRVTWKRTDGGYIDWPFRFCYKVININLNISKAFICPTGCGSHV